MPKWSIDCSWLMMNDHQLIQLYGFVRRWPSWVDSSAYKHVRLVPHLANLLPSNRFIRFSMHVAWYCWYCILDLKFKSLQKTLDKECSWPSYCQRLEVANLPPPGMLSSPQGWASSRVQEYVQWMALQPKISVPKFPKNWNLYIVVLVLQFWPK